MITTGALLHGPRERLLTYSPEEHPVALQLGGADPDALAVCARLGFDAGFDEINLNVGCPSDRVQHARIGACLMREPAHVADCVAAMRAACPLPITVKCRTGVDEQDDYAFLHDFVETVAAAGCTVFIVHARKAILKGLSPAQNRTIPPLDWTRVRRLKADFDDLCFVVNGGLDDVNCIAQELAHVDGAMVGRAAYHNPWLLTEVEARLYRTAPPPSRRSALTAHLHYVEAELQRGTRLSDLTRPLLGLFNGCHGARQFRRHLSEHAHRRGSGIDVLLHAVSLVNENPLEESMARCSNA